MTVAFDFYALSEFCFCTERRSVSVLLLCKQQTIVNVRSTASLHMTFALYCQAVRKIKCSSQCKVSLRNGKKRNPFSLESNTGKKCQCHVTKKSLLSLVFLLDCAFLIQRSASPGLSMIYQILGRNGGKVLSSFPSCYSQSPPLST
jgi:hypothetical protein